ncbi:hypothetical protein MELA_01514 [Candidatus Methylomirabilis lanthanidiphila]|uniref:Uncharacterized protein n=1 Tax=Candidatus Methylomirabilis lanthanidiphila TaxID=2211376 RepID=A0A564ZKQ9_9BACT|nr:hypothetical protein MELA_01514 [Candidatus Methylomirabilis lanthanidiphila]
MKEVQEQHVCETDTKKLYTKPTLTKHKTLRDITAGPAPSVIGD